MSGAANESLPFDRQKVDDASRVGMARAKFPGRGRLQLVPVLLLLGLAPGAWASEWNEFPIASQLPAAALSTNGRRRKCKPSGCLRNHDLGYSKEWLPAQNTWRASMDPHRRALYCAGLHAVIAHVALYDVPTNVHTSTNILSAPNFTSIQSKLLRYIGLNPGVGGNSAPDCGDLCLLFA